MKEYDSENHVIVASVVFHIRYSKYNVLISGNEEHSCEMYSPNADYMSDIYGQYQCTQTRNHLHITLNKFINLKTSCHINIIIIIIFICQNPGQQSTKCTQSFTTNKQNILHLQID